MENAPSGNLLKGPIFSGKKVIAIICRKSKFDLMFGSKNQDQFAEIEGAHVQMYNMILAVRTECDSMKAELKGLNFIKREEFETKALDLSSKADGLKSGIDILDANVGKVSQGLAELTDKVNSLAIPVIPDNSTIISSIESLKATIESLKNRVGVLESKTIDLTPIRNEIETSRLEFNFKFVELVNALSEDVRQKLSFTKGEEYKQRLKDHQRYNDLKRNNPELFESRRGRPSGSDEYKRYLF
jgi:chromosome segregation ATPase